jgi:ubiquinone/menaquinone biosynthesis C-methylase UbiE
MREPQPNPSAILQLGMGFFASRTLLTAVELGLFTELAKAPAGLVQLQARLRLHPRAARDFLDALVALNMIARDSAGLYSNTPETDAFLDKSKPGYVGGILEMCSRRLYGFWNDLPEALHTGEPQNEVKHGLPDLFRTLYGDPKGLEGFLSAMTGLSLSAAHAIAAKFPWSRYKTFIDVGCAQGAVPVTLAQEHTHLSGGGFDLPPVKPIFDAYVARHALSERLRFYPGDFMKDPLPSADVLIMGHILHDWDLPTKRHILESAYRALPKGGALIVYEALIDDERRTNAFGLLMSLNMLIETPGGFDYTGAECRDWMKEVGFSEFRTETLGGPDSMVVGFK